MRTRIIQALPAAALLLLSTVTPAHAGGGLPVLTTLKAGTAEVTIYGDSLFLHPGTNTLTLETTGVPEDAHITMQLTGPGGQAVQVPIVPLHYVVGPDGGHGGGSHGEEAEHGAEASGHGDEHATAEPEEVVWFRGTAKLPAEGYWKAQLTINGATATDELKAVKNGPSPYYLAVTGLAMGGTAVYGFIQRRRQPATGKE